MARKTKEDGFGRGKAWSSKAGKPAKEVWVRCPRTIDIEELIALAAAKEAACRKQADTKGGQR